MHTFPRIRVSPSFSIAEDDRRVTKKMSAMTRPMKTDIHVWASWNTGKYEGKQGKVISWKNCESDMFQGKTCVLCSHVSEVDEVLKEFLLFLGFENVFFIAIKVKD